MAVEGREQVTRIGIVRINGRPEELDGPDGRRQPSMGGTSRVRREVQARIYERLGVKFPGATRPGVKRASCVRRQLSWFTRACHRQLGVTPATGLHRNARGVRGDQGRAPSSVHSSGRVPAHDARAGAKRRHSFGRRPLYPR
jgi:hypothetical protein